MNDSEKILQEILTIAKDKSIGLFEATLLFAEDHNIDIEDIVKVLDDSTINKLKKDALNENLVCNRKEFEGIQITSLF